MIVLNHTVDDLSTISIGKQGENDVTQVVFDYSAWVDLFGEGDLVLIHMRKGDTTAYPIALTNMDGKAVWTVTNTDLANPGYGKCELHYRVDGAIKKSVTFATLVDSSIEVGDAPEPYESIIARMVELVDSAEEAEKNARESEEDARESANKAEESASIVSNVNITASKDGKVATVIATDRDGTPHTVKIRDGEDGKDGKDYILTEKDKEDIAHETVLEINPRLDDIEDSIAGVSGALSQEIGDRKQENDRILDEVEKKANSSDLDAVAEEVDNLDVRKANKSDVYDKPSINSLLNQKQDKLTAGKNITIEDNVISASGDVTREEFDKTEYSLDMLWKLNQGQTYDLVSKEEKGINLPPSGAKYETLLEGYGESEQDSTNGYQLLNLKNGTHTKNGITTDTFDDGTIHIYGTATSFVASYLGEEGIFVASANNAKVFSVEGYATTDWAGMQVRQNDSAISPAATSFVGDVVVRVAVSAGSTIDIVQKPMLEVGTTAHPWEPYTGGYPSPNPDYPQEIHSVEELNLTVMSRNLFDKRNAFYVDKCSITGDVGSRRIEQSHLDTRIYYIPCQPNKKYYYHKTLGTFVRFGFTETIPKIGATVVLDNSIDSGEFLVAPDNANYLIMYPLLSAEIDTIGYDAVLKTIQVGVGNIIPPYTEYFNPITHTITPPHPLNRIGKYRDVCDVENGVWKYAIADCKSTPTKVGFKNNNVWHLSADAYKTVFGLNHEVYRSDVNIAKCNRFICQSGRYNTEDELYIATDGSVMAINVKFFTSADSNGFYDFLQRNELELVAPYTGEYTETIPISESDLELLQSIHNLGTGNVISVTDQDGNDVSYLMEYIIKLSEVAK